MRGDRGSNRPEAWQALGPNPARRWIDALIRWLCLIVDNQLVVPGGVLIVTHSRKPRVDDRVAEPVIVRAH